MIVIISFGLIAGLWIWKSFEISGVSEKARHREQLLTQSAKKQIIKTHEEHLRLLIKPIVWPLRTEMIQGNIDQMNLYLSDMVKEQNFQRIAVADNKGIIIASTNKKDEGMPFSVIGNSALFTSNDTRVENIGDSLLTITSPIMGFNSRLGTIAIKYTIPPVKF